jgi:hypothetical protein
VCLIPRVDIDRPTKTFSDELDQIAEAIDVVHGNRHPVDRRDMREVERSARLITDEEATVRIEFADLMTTFLNAPRPEKSANELRTEAARIAAEYGSPDKVQRVRAA